METREALTDLDQRFIDIYESARAKIVARQKDVALIVIKDDELMLYRHDHAMERFFGLRPVLYDKMKTLGHMPLGIYCLLHDQTGRPLTDEKLTELSDYRDAIKASAALLDTEEQAKTGILPKRSPVIEQIMAFLDQVIPAKKVSAELLAAFAQSVGPEIGPLLAAAAHVQLDALDAIMQEIRKTRLSEKAWKDLRVLVLGPYMAREGQLFLQYYSALLNTPAQGDRRVVYFDGEDMSEAIDRLGTTMLDGEASSAIFKKPRPAAPGRAGRCNDRIPKEAGDEGLRPADRRRLRDGPDLLLRYKCVP